MKTRKSYKTKKNTKNKNISTKNIKQKFLTPIMIKEKKIKKINKNFNKSICSPTKKQNDYTCYNSDELNNIKNIWNNKYPNNKINENCKKKIWVSLMDKMKNVCNDEMCWLNQDFINNNLYNKTINSFAPKHPISWNNNPNQWLTNYDLLNVMKQYEEKYKNFYFIGPSPIDFDNKYKYNDNCICNKLCNFNLKSYIDKGIDKIGVIFNTDTHDKSGSHWISLFINVPEKYIYFFDSGGNKVNYEIYVLVKRIINQSKEIGKELKFYQNSPKVHQKGSSECGMYSLYFIINLLNGNVKPSFFNKKTINDNDVETFRKILFNSPL